MAAAPGELAGADDAGAVDAGGLSPEAALRGGVLAQPASPAPAAPAMSKNFRRSIGTSRTVLIPGRSHRRSVLRCACPADR